MLMRRTNVVAGQPEDLNGCSWSFERMDVIQRIVKSNFEQTCPTKATYAQF